MFSRIKESQCARTAHIIDNGFEKTVSGLALTPSQISKMSEKGLAVSAQISQTFVDGVSNPSFDIPVEERRGVDPVDVWDASQTSRKRIIDAHKKDKQLYGD